MTGKMNSLYKESKLGMVSGILYFNRVISRIGIGFKELAALFTEQADTFF